MARLAVWLVVGMAGASACGDSRPARDDGRCASNADCAAHELCDWTPPHACGADAGLGTCVAYAPGFCPTLAYPVCGCDGHTYTNACFSDVSAVAVAYGGPCRPAGTYASCATSDDCAKGTDSVQACVDDPRDACVPGGGAACPGICVHAAYPCSESLACGAATSDSAAESSGTEACAAVIDCASGGDCSPGRCVYTTRATCAAPAECGAGELCLPSLGGGGGVCVRP